MSGDYYYEYEQDNFYCYPNSYVLKNRLGIVDAEELKNAEREITSVRISQAQRLKKFSQQGNLSFDVIQVIMSEEKKGELEKVTIHGDTLRKNFPKSYTPQKMEETIINLLEQWQKNRQQNIER